MMTLRWSYLQQTLYTVNYLFTPSLIRLLLVPLVPAYNSPHDEGPNAAADHPPMRKSLGDISCPSCAFAISVVEVSGKLHGQSAATSRFSSPTRTNDTPSKSRKRLFSATEELESSIPLDDHHDASNSKLVPTTTYSLTVTPKSRRLVRKEHSYCRSPVKTANELQAVKKELETLKLKYRHLQEKLKRRDRSQSTLRDCLEDLKSLSQRNLDSLI